MSIEKYYIHEVYPYYKNYGLMKAAHGMKKNPVNINQILEEHKNIIKSEIKTNLKTNENIDKELKEYINKIMGLKDGVINKNITTEEFSNIQEAIKKVSGYEITKSINLTDKDKANILSLREEINEKVKKILTPSSKWSMVSIKDLDKCVNGLKTLSKKKIDYKNKAEFDRLVKEITRLHSYVKRNNKYVKSIKVDSFKDGKEKNTKKLINLINEAYRYVNTGAVANRIGEIGELFGLLSTYMYVNKTTEIPEELIKDLINVKNNKGNSNFNMWVGQKGTRKVASKDNLSLNASYIDPDTGIKYIAHKNPTQDKVDFQIQFKDNEIYTFSMKNYSNVSKMTILTGKLLPLLEQYQVFQYHYLNLFATHNENYKYKDEKEMYPLDNDLKKMHDLMILTIGFKALVGGLKALDSNDQLITTPYADYFMFNLNKKQAGIQIYSTTKIMEEAFKLTNTVGRINDLFNVEGINSWNRNSLGVGKNARNSLNVSVHVQLLKRGLPK